jgi:hypothetical protein
LFAFLYVLKTRFFKIFWESDFRGQSTVKKKKKHGTRLKTDLNSKQEGFINEKIVFCLCNVRKSAKL